jgi:ABC-type Fe3+-siderophore transport system permease subunit
MKSEMIAGGVGATLGVIGTITQTNEILQTISLIITIIGAIISMIIVPLISWYQKAKKDGKITSDEIKDGIDIVVGGIKDVQDKLEDKEDGKE